MPRRTPLSSATADDRARARIGTRVVHPPRPPHQAGEPISPPLDLSSTYAFDDVDAFATASRAKTGSGYVYTRWANPTIDAFEAAVADLEGAPAAEAFSSGMAAISSIALALCRTGDRIVTARQLYGGTHSLFVDRLPRYGIETTFADVDDHETIVRSLAGARFLYCETIGNPRIKVANIPRLAGLARGAGVPLVVDNTFASPVLCRPLEHGASIVVHSATKYLGGHHDLIGGVVCADEATIGEIQSLTQEIGPTFSPFGAWLALRGMATLHLRVERASETALVIARMLEDHSDIESVSYPALDSSPDRALAEELLGGRGGGMLGFEVAGGRDRARRFQEALRVLIPAASLGGTHSLIVHAASVTHTQLGDAELRATGISEGYCRLSVGLEDAADLLDDLDQALRSSAS